MKVGIDPKILKLQITSLRTTALFSEEGPDLPPVAEQNYLLAIGSLQQAERFAELANLHLLSSLDGGKNKPD